MSQQGLFEPIKAGGRANCWGNPGVLLPSTAEVEVTSISKLM